MSGNEVVPPRVVMPRWNELNDDQREFLILLYASQWMTEVMGWPDVPPDLTARFAALDEKDLWSEFDA